MWIFQDGIFHFFEYNEKHEGAGKMEASAEPVPGVTTINLSALKFSAHSKLAQ